MKTFERALAPPAPPPPTPLEVAVAFYVQNRMRYHLQIHGSIFNSKLCTHATLTPAKMEFEVVTFKSYTFSVFICAANGEPTKK